MLVIVLIAVGESNVLFPLPQSEAGIKETGNYCGNNVQMGKNLRVLR